MIKIIKHHKGTNIYQLGDGNYFAAIENSKNSNSIGKTTWKSIKKANMSFKIKNNNAIVFGESVKLMTTKLGHYTIPISLNKTVLNNLTTKINTNKTLITTQTNISKYDIATKLQSVCPSFTIKILLNSAGDPIKDDNELKSLIKKVSNKCQICQVYRKAPNDLW